MPQLSEEIYLTPSELAKIWNVSVDIVYDIINSGELPAVNLAIRRKVPRYRIRKVDVEAFESRRTTTKPPKPQFHIDPDESTASTIERWLDEQDERPSFERFKAIWDTADDTGKAAIRAFILS